MRDLDQSSLLKLSVQCGQSDRHAPRESLKEQMSLGCTLEVASLAQGSVQSRVLVRIALPRKLNSLLDWRGTLYSCSLKTTERPVCHTRTASFVGASAPSHPLPRLTFKPGIHLTTPRSLSSASCLRVPGSCRDISSCAEKQILEDH